MKKFLKMTTVACTVILAVILAANSVYAADSLKWSACDSTGKVLQGKEVISGKNNVGGIGVTASTTNNITFVTSNKSTGSVIDSYELVMKSTWWKLYKNSVLIDSYTNANGVVFDFQSKVLDLAKPANIKLAVKISYDYFDVYGPYRVYSDTSFDKLETKIPVLCKQNDYAVFINTDDSDINVGGYNGSSNISFKNINISGNKKTGYNAKYGTSEKDYRIIDSFKFAHAQNLTIENCQVFTGRVGHVIELNSMKNVTIDKCVFKDIVYMYSSKQNKNYVHYTTLGAGDSNSIESTLKNHEVIQFESASALAYDNGDKEIYKNWPTCKLKGDDTVSKDITIKNCEFDDVIRGVGDHFYDSANKIFQENITVQNNTFKNIHTTPIHFQGVKHLTISGNTYSRSSISPAQGNDTKHIVLRNSFIKEFTEVDGVTVTKQLLYITNADLDESDPNKIYIQKKWCKLEKTGDVDFNGQVSLTDVTIIRNYLAKVITLTNDELEVADVNGDGVVNTADVLEIQKFMAHSIVVFPNGKDGNSTVLYADL